MTPLNFAVFGNPIKQSYSPILHQFFAEQTGLNLEYKKVEVPLDQFKAYVEDFFKTGGRGLNITIPFKLEAFEIAQSALSDRAKAAQSVNTLWYDEGKIHGCNTDGIGLVKDLQRLNFDFQNKKILLIGAGGAAQGAILPLLQSQCQALHIANRTLSKAETLAQQAEGLKVAASQKVSFSSIEQIPQSWDLVINASASSLSQSELNLPSNIFAEQSFAYDMLYQADGQTTFVKQALKMGAQQAFDGLGMLVFQGAESFKIWNKVEPKAETVVEQLRNIILKNS